MPYVKNEESEQVGSISSVQCQCGSPARVRDTRHDTKLNTLVRRRECLKCGNRWKTWEVDEREMEMIRAFRAFQDALLNV